jgi:RNA polymerase sigma factor (sigma-70 family)
VDASERDLAERDLAERDAVRAALAQLGPRQRAVVVLRYYCDLSVSDTATVLDCSTGTVKSQATRALATLRRLLADGEAESARLTTGKGNQDV